MLVADDEEGTFDRIDQEIFSFTPPVLRIVQGTGCWCRTSYEDWNLKAELSDIAPGPYPGATDRLIQLVNGGLSIDSPVDLSAGFKVASNGLTQWSSRQPRSVPTIS